MSCVVGDIVRCLFICIEFNVIIVSLISIYLITILLSLGLSNLILFLVILEFLSWLIAIIIKITTAIKYLLLQRYFIILVLIRLWWSEWLILIVFFIKTGLPPFHAWYFNVAFRLNIIQYVVFRTIHKLLPLFFITKLIIEGVRIFILFLLVLSGFLLVQVLGRFFILLVSSLIHSAWILLGTIFSIRLGFIYWAIYCLITSFLFLSININFMVDMNWNQSVYTSINWLILSGIPPFIVFWIKARILLQIIYISNLIGLIILYVSVLALISYFRGFHIGLKQSFYSYYSNIVTISGLALFLFI